MRRLADRVAPWAGLAAGAVAWASHQQILADVQRFDCAAVTTTRAIVALAAALLLCGAGASWSYRRARRGAMAGAGASFAAWLSVVAAGIFALAILMQAAASFTVPGCYR